MKREWKPGDVAAWIIDGQAEIIFRYVDYINENSHEWMTVDNGQGYPKDHEIRPLVVIDPEDREQVERLVKACPTDWGFEQDSQMLRECTDEMQAALRSLIEPSKPDEPTDPKTCVSDRRDNIWRLLADGDWVCTSGPDIGEYLTWDRLTGERGPVSIEVIS